MTTQAITVIVPAKDAETTVGSAAASVLRGLPPGSRVLVRSDGSTDGTADAVRALRDPRVALIEGERPVGVAASLNQLLDRVETPYVARMDADDRSLPGRWRAQLRSLRGGLDIVFTPVLNWFPGTPLIKPQWPEAVSPRLAPLLLLVDNPFMHPTMLARTDRLRDLGGYRSVPSEDYELWLRAAAAGLRLGRLAAPRLLYRRHAGQVTSQAAWRASRATSTLVEESFLALADAALGFRPSWFAWRRDGLQPDRVPAGVLAELDALEARAREVVTFSAARPLLRRTAVLRAAAARGRRRVEDGRSRM